MVLPLSFGPDNQAALDALLAACAQQPGCQAAYPDLAAQWQRLLNSLPQTVSLVHPLSGRTEKGLLQRGMCCARCARRCTCRRWPARCRRRSPRRRRAISMRSVA